MSLGCQKRFYRVALVSCQDPRVKPLLEKGFTNARPEHFLVFWPSGTISCMTPEGKDKYFGGDEDGDDCSDEAVAKQ